VARAAAMAMPIVAAAGTVLLAVFVLPAPTEAWLLAWWTFVVIAGALAALACEPLARRLWIMGLLLDIAVEFPSGAPWRAGVALHATGIAALQRRLAASSHARLSDEVMTTRMATASALGALRVHRLRVAHGLRITSTTVVAVCIALGALVAGPGVSTVPERPLATGRPLGTTAVPGRTVSTAPSPSPSPLTSPAEVSPPLAVAPDDTAPPTAPTTDQAAPVVASEASPSPTTGTPEPTNPTIETSSPAAAGIVETTDTSATPATPEPASPLPSAAAGPAGVIATDTSAPPATPKPASLLPSAAPSPAGVIATDSSATGRVAPSAPTAPSRSPWPSPRVAGTIDLPAPPTAEPRDDDVVAPGRDGDDGVVPRETETSVTSTEQPMTAPDDADSHDEARTPAIPTHDE
jgi:hypothetical protein